MELFHQTVSRLPEKGVRFTSFTLERSYDETENTLERDQVIIDGEAQNTAEPNRYFSNVTKAEGALGTYQWKWLRRPVIDTRKRERTATFRFQGDYIYATPKE